jgi:hypothetical protein
VKTARLRDPTLAKTLSGKENQAIFYGTSSFAAMTIAEVRRGMLEKPSGK